MGKKQAQAAATTISVPIANTAEMSSLDALAALSSAAYHYRGGGAGLVALIDALHVVASQLGLRGSHSFGGDRTREAIERASSLGMSRMFLDATRAAESRKRHPMEEVFDALRLDR